MAFANPTNDATSIWEPDNGIPRNVPTNRITAVGISAAKAVLGLSSVILPTFLITPLPKTRIPLAKLNPTIKRSKFISTSNDLQPIQEESINDICKYNHNNYFYNLKNAFIDTLNIRTITLYILISLGSIFITNLRN